MKAFAKKILVYGTLHGVGFRYRARQKAASLGLGGFVKNVPGGVEAMVEGEERCIQEFVQWIREGEFAPYVTDIKIWEAPRQGCLGFEIR